MSHQPSTPFSAGSGSAQRELTALEEQAFARQKRNNKGIALGVFSLVIFGVLAMILGQNQAHHSVRKKHNSARQLIAESEYEGSLKHGEARTYFAGKAHPERYRKGADGFGLPGTVLGLKAEGKYQKGRKEGLWRTYDAKGRKHEEITYRHDRWFGAYRTYYPNGQLDTELHFGAAEKREGLGRSYFTDGTLANEQPYQRGQLHGTERAWYRNGQLRAEQNFAMGLRSGRSRRWYKNGQLLSEGSFQNEVRVGIWSEYDENGKRILELDWDKGGEVILRDDEDKASLKRKVQKIKDAL